MKENTEKILIVGPSWIGDMVLAQSLYKIIKLRKPHADIDVLAPEWTEPLLSYMPEINKAVKIEVKHGRLSTGLRWRFGRELRKQNYDQAIVLPGSYKSAIIPFLAKIKLRTGFLGELRWGLLNDIRRIDKKMMPRAVDRFVSLGINSEESLPELIPNPSLIVKNKKKSDILNSFGEEASDAAVLGLCPGAEYGVAKRWPAKYFAHVANEKLKSGWKVWLFGSDKDTGITAEIQATTGKRCLDLAGKTSLKEAVDLMSLTNAVVSNDSGLMHIAAALGKHVIAVYGSSNPLYTPPLTDNVDILNLNLSCSPCFERKCPLKHLNCLNDLAPELALKVI